MRFAKGAHGPRWRSDLPSIQLGSAAAMLPVHAVDEANAYVT